MMVFHGHAREEVTSLRPRPGDGRLESEVGGSSIPGRPVWASSVSETRGLCGWVQCMAMRVSLVFPRTEAGAPQPDGEGRMWVGKPNSMLCHPVTPL